MNNKDLFKEAIAEAKLIKDAALINAKKALEETLSPKLAEMLDAKLSEDLGDDFSDEDDLSENINLDAILAELEGEDGLLEAKDDEDKEPKDDDKDDDKEDKKDADEKPKAKPAAKPDPKEDEDDFGLEGDDELVKDLSVEALKAIIGDIVNSELNGGSEDGDVDGLGDLGNGGRDEDEFDGEDDLDGGFDLEELLSELDGLEDEGENLYEAKTDKEDLKEAIKTIKSLKSTLNEVNVSNAKLLYVNKIFSSRNLSESQKVNVLSVFEKAKTTSDAKLIYESLSTTIKTAPKSVIKESRGGYASKPMGTAPVKQPIIAVDESVERFKRLAGIKKD